MGKKISQNFIKGIGSVMDIYPEKRYLIRSYEPDKATDADRLKGDWIKIGKAISKAAGSHNYG